MSQDQFVPGDVVVLKSGSPKMTVVNTATPGTTICTYYDENSKTFYKGVSFLTVTLKKDDTAVRTKAIAAQL